jgi:hypothetical protein
MRASRSLGAVVIAALAMGVSLQACAHNPKPGQAAPKGMTAAPC